LAAALDSAGRAYIVAKDIEDPIAEVSALTNMGLAIFSLGRVRDGIAVLQAGLRTAEEIQGSGADLLRAKLSLCSNLADCYNRVGDHARALHFAERGLALAVPSSITEANIRVSAEANLVEALLGLGRIAEAKMRMASFQSQGDLTGFGRTELSVARVNCLIVFYEGDWKEAIEGLKKYLAFAREAYPVETDVVLRDLIRVYETVGDFDAAIATLKELIDLVRARMMSATMIRHQAHVSDIFGSAESTGEEEDLVAHSVRLSNARIAARRAEERALESLERTAQMASLAEDASGAQIYRVGELARRLAIRIGISENLAFRIGIAARLRDIGKLWISRDELLLKPRSLTPEELALVREHAAGGADMLVECNLGELGVAVEIARSHHENWDGSGYPDGFAGETIPQAARIVALADCFDALTHERPHRKSWPVWKALEWIGEESGRKFDPRLVGPFIEIVRAAEAIGVSLDATLGEAAGASPFVAARRKVGRVVGLDGELTSNA